MGWRVGWLADSQADLLVDSQAGSQVDSADSRADSQVDLADSRADSQVDLADSRADSQVDLAGEVCWVLASCQYH
jgi:hypothetical protein